MTVEDQVAEYCDRGYFIADDAVAPDMLGELAGAVRRCAEKVRSGEVVDDNSGVRTNGPGAVSQDIRALLAPEFCEPIFARYLLSEPLHRYVQPLLGGGEELRLGWVSAFAFTEGTYDTGWHRDFGGEERDGSYEVEMEILGRYRKNLVKWHLALADDPCLWLVPGSQRRYRSDEEREALLVNKTVELSGARQVALARGQTVFWSGNTIHRGRLPDEGLSERLTLTGSLVRHRMGDVQEMDDRFRWYLAGNVRGSLPDGVRRYCDNWRSAVRA